MLPGSAEEMQAKKKKKKQEVESTLDYRQVENERRVPITYCSTQAA